MFDIGWTELLVIAVVAVLVVGPRELPRMLRTLGNFLGQMRRMAGDFQRQFNDAIREAELDDVKRGFDSVRDANPANSIRDSLNPVKKTGESMRDAIEGSGKPKPDAKVPPAKKGGPAKEPSDTVAEKPAAPAEPAKKTAPAKGEADPAGKATPEKSAAPSSPRDGAPAKARTDAAG